MMVGSGGSESLCSWHACSPTQGLQQAAAYPVCQSVRPAHASHAPCTAATVVKLASFDQLLTGPLSAVSQGWLSARQLLHVHQHGTINAVAASSIGIYSVQSQLKATRSLHCTLLLVVFNRPNATQQLSTSTPSFPPAPLVSVCVLS